MNSEANLPLPSPAVELKTTDPETIEYGDDPAALAETILRRQSESDTVVPLRNLKVVDVAALIFNKMVGTGIFTTPGAVLIATKSKAWAIIFWFLGGVYSLTCLAIYLEYAIALPFNGGELIYLNEIFHAPNMLATILYAGLFISFANSAGNAFAFAKFTLIAARHLGDGPVANASNAEAQLDPTLIRFIAIFIVTIVCFLHYTWSRLGLFLNKLFALYKIFLCLFVFGAGVAVWKKPSSGVEHTESFGEMYNGSVDSLSALLIIFYAYEGWENATYVAGEIHALRKIPGRKSDSRTLRWGAMLAVGLVTILYILVATGYYVACTYKDITDSRNDVGIAIHFAYQILGSTTGLSIAIALSAVGNLIAVIYTCAKVKQAIAVQRILPFWEFLERDRENPRGAFVLHWIATTIFLVTCPTSADGYSFTIGIYEYSRTVFTLFVAFGFLFLQKRMEPGWQPQTRFLRPKIVRWIFVTIFLGLDMLVVVYAPKQRDNGDPNNVDRIWWPGVFSIVVAASSLYWIVLRVPQIKQRHNPERTWGDTLGFKVTVYRARDPLDTWPIYLRVAKIQATEDGTERRVEYQLSGPLRRIADLFQQVGSFFYDYIW